MHGASECSGPLVWYVEYVPDYHVLMWCRRCGIIGSDENLPDHHIGCYVEYEVKQ
jgi:hypothetical protein